MEGKTYWGTPGECTRGVRTVRAGTSAHILYVTCLREEVVYVLLCCCKGQVADIHLQHRRRPMMYHISLSMMLVTEIPQSPLG